jgi:hypothetical protein
LAAKISERKGNEITIEIKVKLSGSILEREEQILEGLNEGGNAATQELLKDFDADGEDLILGGTTWYSKGQLSKTYNTPYGTTTVERHVYQSAKGGTTICPLEDNARIIRNSTPRFVKMITHKFAHNAANQVMEDFKQNHGRPCLRATLQDIVTHVGTVVQEKEEIWEYATPKLESKVATVGIGVDGACMLLCDKKWREAMTGSVSLYDKEGERLHTIYVGAAPEYGKKAFYERMTREIAHVKKLYPKAKYAGIADGARSNWDYLGEFIDQPILDFYHVTEYLADAAQAMGGTEETRKQWLDETCHKLKLEPNAAKKLLRELQKAMDQSKRIKKAVKEALQKCITYFTNHLHQMDYVRYREQGYPIGSGVTEAACKTLVKQRLCRSGMRWTPDGAQNILSLRALVMTNGRWEQFWNKISQNGVPKIKH